MYLPTSVCILQSCFYLPMMFLPLSACCSHVPTSAYLCRLAIVLKYLLTSVCMLQSCPYLCLPLLTSFFVIMYLPAGMFLPCIPLLTRILSSCIYLPLSACHSHVSTLPTSVDLLLLSCTYYASWTHVSLLPLCCCAIPAVYNHIPVSQVHCIKW